jgi:hypothetical protein
MVDGFHRRRIDRLAAAREVLAGCAAVVGVI